MSTSPSVSTGPVLVKTSGETMIDTFPENVAVRWKICKLFGVTIPSTVIRLQPLKPPVSGPNMLQRKVPPVGSAVKPKSDGDGIVFPGRLSRMRPMPATCGPLVRANTGRTPRPIAAPDTAPCTKVRRVIAVLTGSAHTAEPRHASSQTGIHTGRRLGEAVAEGLIGLAHAHMTEHR